MHWNIRHKRISPLDSIQELIQNVMDDDPNTTEVILKGFPIRSAHFSCNGASFQYPIFGSITIEFALLEQLQLQPCYMSTRQSKLLENPII